MMPYSCNEAPERDPCHVMKEMPVNFRDVSWDWEPFKSLERSLISIYDSSIEFPLNLAEPKWKRCPLHVTYLFRRMGSVDWQVYQRRPLRIAFSLIVEWIDDTAWNEVRSQRTDPWPLSFDICCTSPVKTFYILLLNFYHLQATIYNCWLISWIPQCLLHIASRGHSGAFGVRRIQPRHSMPRYCPRPSIHAGGHIL